MGIKLAMKMGAALMEEEEADSCILFLFFVKTIIHSYVHFSYTGSH